MNTIRRGKKFCSRVFTMGRRRWITPTRVGGQVWAGVSTGILHFFFRRWSSFFVTCCEPTTTTSLHRDRSRVVLFLSCQCALPCLRTAFFRFILLDREISQVSRRPLLILHLFVSTTHNRVSTRYYLPAMLVTATQPTV